MVDTPRTTAQLVTASADNTSGLYTNQNVRDLIVSTQQWDVVSGSPVVNLMRGTVDGAAYFVRNGGVIGAGQTTTQRQTNATVLNTLFSYCVTNGKFCELAPGVYEINSTTGLLIPAGGYGNYNMTFRGSRIGTVITQFYAGGTGAPVLTIGDIAAVTSMDGIDISGLTLNYGASQTGLTSATALVIGDGSNGAFSDISISPNFSANPGYDGMRIGDASAANFSMFYRGISVMGWQRYALNFNAGNGSTGNHFDNFYLAATSASSGATNSQNAVTGYIKFNVGCQDMQFSRLNTEWGACNIVVDCQNSTIEGLTFDAWHMEGVNLTGSTPAVINMTGAQVLINSLDIVNPFFLSANTPRLIQDWTGGSSSIMVHNLSTYPQTSGKWTTPLILYAALGGATLGDDVPMVQINSFQAIAASSLASPVQFDVHMPAASFNTPLRFGRYVYGPGGSRVERAVISVSATYTHYGQHEDANILVPFSITSFTLTLGNRMGATGTQLPRTGNTVHIRRLSGTASGTLTITNGGAGGTGAQSNVTNTTSATDYFYVFNGTDWISTTMVT